MSEVISCEDLKNNYKIETNTEFKWQKSITFVPIIEFIVMMLLLCWIYYIVWGKYSNITNVIAKNESINKKNI